MRVSEPNEHAPARGQVTAAWTPGAVVAPKQALTVLGMTSNLSRLCRTVIAVVLALVVLSPVVASPTPAHADAPTTCAQGPKVRIGTKVFGMIRDTSRLEVCTVGPQVTVGLVGRYGDYFWNSATYTVNITQRGSRTPVFSTTTTQNPAKDGLSMDLRTRMSFDLRDKLASGQIYTIKIVMLADQSNDGKKPFRFTVSSKFVA